MKRIDRYPLRPIRGQIPQHVIAAIKDLAAARFEGNLSMALRLVLAAGLEALGEKQEAVDAT